MHQDICATTDTLQQGELHLEIEKTEDYESQTNGHETAGKVGWRTQAEVVYIFETMESPDRIAGHKASSQLHAEPDR